jgi:hypothetical protein
MKDTYPPRPSDLDGVQFRRSSKPALRLPHTVAATFLAVFLMLAVSNSAHAIPAFARKTGLRCSACHEAWPKLSAFGQNYKDNGYQIGNERDAPIYLSPLYWPISLRITPQWHSELNTATPTDQSASGVQSASTQGFDLSGMDLLAEGILSKDITFMLLPSSDEYGNFHFESAWVRFDNLMKSTWLNLKGGKFELDTIVSEKRILTLSQNGGFYQIYHYLPPIDPAAYSIVPTAPGELGTSTTSFGLGDNQLGAELGGHSRDDYTRYSVALLTSSDGSVDLPTSSAYDTFLTASHAVNAGSLGLQRFAAFSYIGQSPTRFLTQTAGHVTTQISGSGYGNKDFTRTGVYALLKAKQISLTPMFTHATESAFVALGVPSSDILPTGVQSPAWNGRMLELNYVPTLKFAFIGRYEDIRNTRQTFVSSRSNYGDLDTETVAFRYYPFTTSRDGFALHFEYSKVHSIDISAIGGNQTLRSGFIGWDFAF